MTTRALVRKTPRVSQVGNVSSLVGDNAFQTMKMFMSNDPSSPTHWLSQVRKFFNGFFQIQHTLRHASLESPKTQSQHAPKPS